MKFVLPLWMQQGYGYVKRFCFHHKLGICVAALAWLLYEMSSLSDSSDINDRVPQCHVNFSAPKVFLAIATPIIVLLVVFIPIMITLRDKDARLRKEYTGEIVKNINPSHTTHKAHHGITRVEFDITLPKEYVPDSMQPSTRPVDNDSNDRIKALKTRSIQTNRTQAVELANKTVMTHTRETEHKAVNTHHHLAHIRSIGTETTGPYKKKLRRAQRLLREALCKSKEDKKARVEQWRRILAKYREKLIKILRTTDEKNTLMAYVRTTNQSSEKDIQGTAIALSDLKWKLQYQRKLNEKFSEDLRNKRAIVNSLAQIIKPETEKP